MELPNLLSRISPKLIILSLGFCLAARFIYNIFFHKLSRFPGPRLATATRLQYAWYLWRGCLHEHIKSMHDIYGPVVRIAPDELSFISGSAWTDIYCGGFGNKGFPKHSAYHKSQTFESLFDADNANHSRLRRLLRADFFSQRSARIQEKVVQDYTGRLIEQLRNQFCSESRPVDLCKWYNYLTFDIACYIVMSNDFGCLSGQAYHPWVLMVLSHLRLATIVMILRLFPPLDKLALFAAPPYLQRLRDNFFTLIRDRLDCRVKRTLPQGETDFVQAALGLSKKPPGAEVDVDNKLSFGEIEANSILLLLAGSETMTTSLLSATHFLCENPIAMDRLVREVRTHAKAETDIHFDNVMNMTYLNAVICESHRLSPIIVNGPARVVDREGATIAGHSVPVGTAVGVTQFAANRADCHFTRPNDFIPERWLSREQADQYAGKDECNIFANDSLDVVRPFSLGGRDCLGKNFALMEFRVVLARMLWNFDFKVHRERVTENTGSEVSKHLSIQRWTDQKAHILWAKKNYYVQLEDRGSNAQEHAN